MVNEEEGSILPTIVRNHFVSCNIVKGLQMCRSGHRQSITWWALKFYSLKLLYSLWVFIVSELPVDNGLLTTCYKVVDLNRLVTSCNNLLSSCNSTTSQEQLDRISALLQLVDKLATSLLRKHLVDKLWDFHVCSPDTNHAR